MKITHEQLVESIQSTNGNVSAIARKFQMTRPGVAKRINKNIELRELHDEQSETLLDVAECQLANAVRRGSPWAVKFVLATKGRSRGYGRETKVQIEETQRKVVLVLPMNNRNPHLLHDCVIEPNQ